MPRLLVLTAPGGYGKTTTALEYANIFKSHAVIDLTRTQSPRALLLALLKTLLSEEADRSYLRQVQLSLAADEAVPPLLAERVLDVWRDPGAPGAVVFDNAERLPREMLPLFKEVVERRPGHRACVVCSRTPLQFGDSPAESPVEALAIDAGNLALSEEQTQALFADSPISTEQLRVVMDLADGWPLATLLLRRLHTEGRLSSALYQARQAGDADGFYEFVQDQIMESLPLEQRRVIEFCASVPEVKIQDVQTCLGWQGADALHAIARTLPLIRIREDRVEVHSLLGAAIARRMPNPIEDLRLAARAALRRGDRDSAAERYIACGDREEAVKVLDDVLERGATAAVATLASSLDQEIMDRHPRWFAMTALLRRYDVPPAKNLASVQSRRARVNQTGDPVARFALGVLETHQLLHSGSLEQVQERLHDLNDVVAELKRGGIAQAIRAHVAARIVDSMRAIVAVAQGEADKGERLLKRARFAIGQFPMITVSAAVDGWLGIGLLRGNLQLIREHFLHARESLTRAGLDIVLLDLDVNEAFAGWVLGDDSMYAESVKRLDERARMYRTQAFDHALGCVGLRAECDAIGVEPLRRLIFAHLVASGRLNGEPGLRHAQDAMLFARELRQPLFVTLAAIAVRERGGDPACEPAEMLALAPAVQDSFLERMHRG